MKYKDKYEGKPVVLDVQNLQVNFTVHGGEVKAVRDVSFKVREGECYCIVGESGSGKSVTMQSIMGILPSPPSKILGGKAFLSGVDLLSVPLEKKNKILGKDIAMIFQDPLTSLNPLMTIGKQIEEMLILHTDLDAPQRKARVVELLTLVRIPEPQKRFSQYPHELSGGMRQRVMIAMALTCNPKLLVADEPTTALDVTIQAQVLSLVRELAVKFNMAVVLITHDLAVVAQMADRVAVMYAGKIVEEGLVEEIFYYPAHPYNIGLKRAMPQENKEALVSIPGTPPDLFAPPSGCGFSPRCPNALKLCHTHQPEEFQKGSHRASCWLQHQYGREFLASAGLKSLEEEVKS